MRTKAMTPDKAPVPVKVKIARPIGPAQTNIDDDAEDKQRSGIQSLGRAFAILEEVARHREGIALADLSKRVGLHNSTAFHLVKTMVSLGYIRQEKDTKRYRVGRPLFALAASSLDTQTETDPTSVKWHVRAARSFEALGDERRACAHWRSRGAFASRVPSAS